MLTEQKSAVDPLRVGRPSTRGYLGFGFGPVTPTALPHHVLPQVPGNYFDAMDPKTKLGKAVRAAVDELNHLNAMVRSAGSNEGAHTGIGIARARRLQGCRSAGLACAWVLFVGHWA